MKEVRGRGLMIAVELSRALDASLEKAKLRYDFEFHLPLLEDVRRVARGILRDTTQALPPLG